MQIQASLKQYVDPVGTYRDSWFRALIRLVRRTGMAQCGFDGPLYPLRHCKCARFQSSRLPVPAGKYFPADTMPSLVSECASQPHSGVNSSSSLGRCYDELNGRGWP